MHNNISNELLKMISKEVELKYGLYFPEHRFKDLYRGLVNAANLKGIDINKYIELFLGKLLSSEESKELANCLTIGETYFFRDKKLFDALRRNVIPNIIHSKAKTRTITIWSSGCSTGEEAFTIAILMKELLVNIDNWTINIVATDINLNSISKAKNGVYGEWSFRETDNSFKDKYFDVIQPGQYKLKDEIKKKVKFSYLNLANDIYFVEDNLLREVDIIFCRNVLMYFREEQAIKIVNKYYDILSKDGWLIVAPSESIFLNKTSFISKNIGDTFIYTKTVEEKHIKPKVATVSPAVFQITERSKIKQDIIKKINISTEKYISPKNVVVDFEAQIRAKANEGNLEEAKMICENALNQNKVNPIYYHLLASIEQELGNIQHAINALKKAIYLDSNFIMAYFDLGNLFLKVKKVKEAIKSFDNVNILLQDFEDNENIPNAEAITASMLKHFIENILKDKDIYG